MKLRSLVGPGLLVGLSLVLLSACAQLADAPGSEPPPLAVEEEAVEAAEPATEPSLTTSAARATTFSCGGEGEKPCGADTDFFWDNGNLFADRGLKATGFNVLPDIAFNVNDFVNLDRINLTTIKTMIEVEWPALEARLTGASFSDFTKTVCFPFEQGGKCYLILPTPPIPVMGYIVYVPFKGDTCVPLTAGFTGDCILDYIDGTSGTEIPGIPIPDPNAPGWTLVSDLASFIERLAIEAAQFRSVLTDFPTPPVVDFDISDYSLDPEVFDLTSFSSALDTFESLIVDNEFLTFFEDLIEDFFDPQGIVVNHTRRQQHATDFQNTWEYWALAQQRELSKREPINWAQSLGTHNAFNNKADGYPLPNQAYSMTDQLRMGSRVLALDLHFLNGQLRLCHGQPDGTGCAIFDRYYANGIKEIGNWLRANPGEVIVLDLEDRSGDDQNAYVNDPIRTYLVDAVGNSLVWAPKGGDLAPDLWPSVQDMRDARKQVLIFGGEAHGGEFIFAPDRNGLGSQQMKNFYITDADYAPASGAPGEHTGGAKACWSYENATYSFPFTRVGDNAERITNEDNTDNTVTTLYEGRALLDAFAPTGLIDEAAVAMLANCNVSIISLDFFEAKEQTTESNCANDPACRTPDERVKSAIWSWRENDLGLNGNAGLANGSDGRWSSANKDDSHRFACALPREGDTSTWVDKPGALWKITEGSGPWSQGGQQCFAEFGDDGYVFGVPAFGWQNEQLQLVNTSSDDVWINYGSKSGAWVVNQRPTAVAGSDVSANEGSLVSFDGRGSSDPDAADVLTYHWDLGDGSTAAGAQPTHTYADDGTYTVTLSVSDGFAGFDTDTLEVTVSNVAPTVAAGVDANVDEGAEVVLTPVTFTDPGFSCPTCDPSTLETFTATIDWGEGTVDAATPVVTGGSAGVATSGTVTGAHTYGDDGVYTVTIKVCDDDGGCHSHTLNVTVGNLVPSVTLDVSQVSTLLNGDEGIFGRSGVAQSFRADGSDPGSDDLTFGWTFAPSAITFDPIYFNDGNAADGLKTPHGTFPFLATDTATPTFTVPNVYTLALDVDDDDGGTSNVETATLLVTDDRTCTSVFPLWGQQYAGSAHDPIDTARLEAYLAIVRTASGFFDATNLASVDDAEALLSPKGGGGPARLAQQSALAAWLNFASGGVLWDQSIGQLDETFVDVMRRVETTLLDAGATNTTYAEAMRLAQFVNVSSPGPCGGSGTP